MLRDFGILTVVDLSVSLLGVMLVLPAALIWAEQRQSAKTSAEPAQSRPVRAHAGVNDEDRFGDLGDGEVTAAVLPSAWRRRTACGPRPTTRAGARRRSRGPGNKYAWVVGIVMVMGIGVLLLTTAIPNRGVGFRGPTKDQTLPDFAAPLVTGNVEGDANVFQKRNAGSDDPAACEVRGEGVVNICELRKKPVVLVVPLRPRSGVQLPDRPGRARQARLPRGRTSWRSTSPTRSARRSPRS